MCPNDAIQSHTATTPEISVPGRTYLFKMVGACLFEKFSRLARSKLATTAPRMLDSRVPFEGRILQFFTLLNSPAPLCDTMLFIRQIWTLMGTACLTLERCR